MFYTFLFCLFMWRLIGVFGVDADEVKSVSVMEGDSVTLYTNINDKQRTDELQWRFRSQEYFIVHHLENENTFSRNGHLDDSFTGRLHMDDQTGSLIITNITTDHSGLYRLLISDRIFRNGNIRKTLYRFKVTVYACLPVPVIISYCPQNPPSSSVSKCVLACSLMNMAHVSLSWYKGKSLLSSISVSDLNIRLSLPLEVDHQDTNTYICVLNHPNSNQTQHLNITHVYQMCSGCLNYCYTGKAVIRLVASVLVGVAAVATCAVLIHYIRSRRAEQERRSSANTSYRDAELHRLE